MPDTMYTGRTIDMTPTWEALVRPMCAVLENPSRKPDVADAKRNIRGQFMRMADAADRYNVMARKADLPDGLEHTLSLLTSLSERCVAAFALGMAERTGNVGRTYDDDARSVAYDMGRDLAERIDDGRI
jgi:hypothetical protein